MKNSFTIVTDVYKVLATQEVKDMLNLSGDIWKRPAPAGGTKEDIVINCLAANNEQLEKAVVNVNIHVPNMPVHANGIQDKGQPDHRRLEELTGIVENLLHDYWNNEANFSLQVIQPGVLMHDEATGGHYANIRLEYYFENVNA